MDDTKIEPGEDKGGWGGGLVAGLILGGALFMLTFKILLMAR